MHEFGYYSVGFMDLLYKILHSEMLFGACWLFGAFAQNQWIISTWPFNGEIATRTGNHLVHRWLLLLRHWAVHNRKEISKWGFIFKNHKNLLKLHRQVHNHELWLWRRLARLWTHTVLCGRTWAGHELLFKSKTIIFYYIIFIFRLLEYWRVILSPCSTLLWNIALRTILNWQRTFCTMPKWLPGPMPLFCTSKALLRLWNMNSKVGKF